MATTHAPTPDLLSLVDIADATKSSVHSVRKWARRGFPDFPEEAFKLPNGEWRCRSEDFERWLDYRSTARVA